MFPRRTLLVVDPKLVICEIVSNCFEDWPGTDLDCVVTTERAVEKITTCKYDLAILDLMLPRTDSFRVAELAANENIPVLFMSADLNVVDELSKARFPFIAKPFSIASLLAESKAAIAGARDNIRRVQESVATMQVRSHALQAVMHEADLLVAESRRRRERPGMP
jgi:DNA-binding response OmpR family regulator